MSILFLIIGFVFLGYGVLLWGQDQLDYMERENLVTGMIFLSALFFALAKFWSM